MSRVQGYRVIQFSYNAGALGNNENVSVQTVSKGGFFSESAMCFSKIQISKRNIPNHYQELEI